MDEKSLRRADAELAGWSDPTVQLRRALDNDELELYCQPIRALIGTPGYPLAEILVRMRQEERALLPPGDFLPVFEHYGMMPQLDRWVVRKVAERLARGSRVPRLTINASSQSIEDAAFPAFFAAQLTTRHLAPGSILLEIDESDALTRPEPVAKFAAAIKAAGGGLLVDGFGRKAVSFAVLKTLRVDYIKVDGAITRKLLANEAAIGKMKAIVRVAEAIGAGVIAEFVEDPDVLVRLKALDVGYAQGFGVYQPQPIEAVLRA